MINYMLKLSSCSQKINVKFGLIVAVFNLDKIHIQIHIKTDQEARDIP